MIFRRFFQSSKKEATLSTPLDPSDDEFVGESDPELFNEILQIKDPEQRAHVLKNRPHDALFFELMMFGSRWDENRITPMVELYSSAVDAIPLETRRKLLQLILHFLRDKLLGAFVLIPPAWADTDRFIVSTAVAEMLNFSPVLDGDPMVRAREIVQMMEKGAMINPGAAFGGLLHFGNREVCELIWPLKDRLSTEQVMEGVMSYTGNLSAACIEFEITWLEHINLANKELFAAVAFALRQQRLAAKGPDIATGTRKFPLESTSPEEMLALTSPMPIEDYVRTIAPRLQALAHRVPLIMPDVASVWGVEPLATQEEKSDRSTQH